MSPRSSRSTASRREAGFSLVELMVVVLLFSVASAVALNYSREQRGARSPEFGRSLLSMIHEARHAAVTLGQPTRIQLIPPAGLSSVMQAATQQRDPANPANWLPLGGVLNSPQGVSFCMPDSAPSLSPATPVCPLAAGFNICFASDSSVSVTQTSTCPASGGPGVSTGATIYFTTIDNSHQHKIPIFALTGLAKLVDRW